MAKECIYKRDFQIFLSILGREEKEVHFLEMLGVNLVVSTRIECEH